MLVFIFTCIWWIPLVLFFNLVQSSASNDTLLHFSLHELRTCQKNYFCSWVHDCLPLYLFIYLFILLLHQTLSIDIVFYCRNTSARARAISCLWFYWLGKKHFKSREILGTGELQSVFFQGHYNYNCVSHWLTVALFSFSSTRLANR